MSFPVPCQWSRLLSDLGGQFGLWLGFSLLTAVEILQLIFDICHHFGRRLCSMGRRITAEDNAIHVMDTKEDMNN